MRRQYHLSLREDDEFELCLWQAFQKLPHGYPKHFLVRIARMVCPQGATVDELAKLMRSIVVDVRPLALKVMPEVGDAGLKPFQPSEDDPVRPPSRQQGVIKAPQQAASAAARAFYERDEYDELSRSIPAQ